MKIKADFVTNSSSTAFIITNITNDTKDLVTFVKENPQLIKEFKREFHWYKIDPQYTQEKLIESAKQNNMKFKPKNKKYCVFGDEQGTLVGKVFDYMLRNGGTSKSFTWRFNEYLR